MCGIVCCPQAIGVHATDSPSHPQLWPQKFQNKTNGVTQRRWLAFCNPQLRQLISTRLGNDEWIRDLYKLQVGRSFVVARFLDAALLGSQ